MSRWSLSEWLELCRRQEVDGHIVGGIWGSSTITPPPTADPPLVRYPLAQAEALIAALPSTAAPTEHRRVRLEALEWLAHPHPRASPSLRRAMATRRREIEALLD